MSPDASLTLESFRAAVDTSFQVRLDGRSPAELTLVEVTVFDRQPGWESFSLLFLGPTPAFDQATYVVDHAEIGSFKLFLVPIHSAANEQRYEAVFIRQTG